MRLLFVAFGHSIHTARWIGQLAGRGWDIHLFPAEARSLHLDLRDLTVHEVLYARPKELDQSVTLRDDWFPMFRKGFPFPPWDIYARRLARRFIPSLMARSQQLAHLVDRVRPDLIHSLCMHDPGFLVFQARRFTKKPFPPWIISNWGSDISLFGRLAAYSERIKEMLAACNYYACECQRDIELARVFGFRGEFFPVLPVAGGLALDTLDRFRLEVVPSKRKLILIKGYQSMQGRAYVALRALEHCADLLSEYEIAIFSAGAEVQTVAELVSQKIGVPIHMIPPCTHDELLRWQSRARVSIGLSISDGISTSLLEAMAMGAFPIQSDTGCACEWIVDGETGFLVHPDDSHDVSVALRRVLIDDVLVDHAARRNAEVVANRLDAHIIQPQVITAYESAFEHSLQSRRVS